MKHKARQEVKTGLYNTFAVPILLRNCETWGMTKQKQKKLNTYHQKQLRRVIGKHCPDKISNKKFTKNVTLCQ